MAGKSSAAGTADGQAVQQGPRGAFIVFEGADRAGKSTQCQMLVEHLQVKRAWIQAEIPQCAMLLGLPCMLFQFKPKRSLITSSQRLTTLPSSPVQASGVNAELWRFPDRTTAIGKMINSYLTSQSEIDDAAVHLLFCANRWEKR